MSTSSIRAGIACSERTPGETPDIPARCADFLAFTSVTGTAEVRDVDPAVDERPLEALGAEVPPGLILVLADREHLRQRDRRWPDVERQVEVPGQRQMDVDVRQS